MSWIKENKFLAGLCGGTLVGMIVLFLVGSKGMKQYTTAKEEFDAAAEENSTYERLPLYPKRENLDGKKKALDDYRAAVESLQAAFGAYRPEALQNVSPEVFTNQLKAANDQARKAFEEAGTTVPDAFFCGFEGYKTSLARGSATGILSYELDGIKKVMLALAESGATELKNLYRPELPEEQGKEFVPQPSDVARPLPFEITFQGSEKAVRAFLSSIANPEQGYFIIRSMRVTNTKKDPPRISDAKFEEPAEAAAATGGDLFGGFVMPGEEPAGEGEAAPDQAAPEPEAAVADSSRILSQVLGDEELQVFLRIDLMQFLPAKKLP